MRKTLRILQLKKTAQTTPCGSNLKKQPTPAVSFACAVLIMTAGYWLTMFLTRSSNIGAYFLTDYDDTFMDYFNMLSNISHGDPYYAYANYPAICFLFWRVMHHFLPTERILSYDAGVDLRIDMVAQLGFILFVAICLITIWEMLHRIIKGTAKTKLFFSLSLCFSGPMFFLLERGNILLSAFAFLLVFLALYDSPKRSYRIIAYIFLSLAAAIKIYPAVFGLLVLQKKRYKEAALLVIFGILFFILPFFAFNGIDSLLTMVEGFSYSASLQSNSGFGHNFSFFYLLRIIGGYFGGNLTSAPAWLPMIPLGFCTLLYCVSKKEWQRLYALVLLCVWLPNFSYTYTLVLFILPILSFYFRNDQQIQNFKWVYTVLFVLLMIPYALPLIDRINLSTGLNCEIIGPGGIRYPVSWGSILIHGSILLIPVMIFAESILCKNRNTVTLK